ncbi:serine hydrolase domain-containing protein [Streptomyces sp. NPDC054932]
MIMVALGSGIFLMPRPPALSGATTGDAALAAEVRAAAGDVRGYRGIAVALIDGDRVRFSGLGESGNPERPGVDESTVFEAGSLGKPMTGMLLAELASRQSLNLDVPLQDLLPDMSFRDRALGAASLRDLASHRAGLDLMPANLDTFLRGAELKTLGKDPYRGMTQGDVFTAGQNAVSSGTGRFRYSNLGMALAGQTAARVRDKPYEQLLQEHVLTPLDMRGTRMVHSGTTVPPNSATGYKSTGAVMEHWLTSGYTPAGDVWSTSEDLARLLQAQLNGTAPGAEAAVPRFDAGKAGQIGLGWYTTRTQGRDITWHDGVSGGFTSYMGFDRSSRKGVVVLSNTNRPVQAIGKRLLGLTADADPALATTRTALTALCSTGAAGPVLYVALRRFPRRSHGIHLGISTVFGVALLALVRRTGDWLSVPPVVWALGGALLSAGILLGARRRPSPGHDRQAGREVVLPAARYGGALLLLLSLVVAAEL